MTMINRLPPQVADMIAAGEVVERPASVVKELVENSIDAGAKSITVELRRGGMAMLRIADDGAGMSPEDAPTAFLRHATSKLRDERGLEAIGTLGFRGEALAAVASVSRIELTTRRCGASSGVTLSLEGGIDVGGGATPVGCPEGTTIVVRDLFFNTPARLKFMKTDSAESAAAVNAAVRSAMSHPEIAFRVLKDGEEVFRTSGSGDIKDCVYALLGRDTALSLVEIPESGDASAGVRGLISDPTHVRGNRSNQFFFVNNRYVKSQLLQAALEQAYRNLIPSGRFPACVLYLTLRLNAVDVNVHPAKTEIKFLYERAVFDLVHYAVKSRLTARQATATPEPRNATSEPRNATPEPRNATPEPRNATPEPRSTVNEAAHYQVVAELYTRSQAELSSMPIAEHQAEPPVEPPTEPHTIAEPGSLTPPDPGYRIVGEVYGGYIVVELESELLFIDKHAAHERVLFDRLKLREYFSMPQLLITPLVLEPSADDGALILANLPILEKLGFSIDDFGGGALAVRQIPSEIDQGAIPSLIEELADSIRNGNRPGSLGRVDEILSTVACKAAIKLGWITDPAEFVPLVEAVLSGSVTHCPHGRPITFRLPRMQIEKAIRRK